MSATTKLRRTLALVLAGGSLAIGVPAALAAGGDGGEGAAAPNTGFVQDEQSEQGRPDRDCPERGGSGEEGGASGDGATTTPAV
jgi:hypothetical protein